MKTSQTSDYDSDWESDYSDDWEPDIEQKLVSLTNKHVSKSIPEKSMRIDSCSFQSDFLCLREAAIKNPIYRDAIDRCRAKNLEEVSQLILKLSSGRSLIDRAWIVFYWISQNIEYDVDAYFSGHIRHQSDKDVFTSRKAVCDGFGTIFESLCTSVKIKCKKISGYAKGHGFKVNQKTFTKTNHAWNAIELDGRWYLVDSTWGSGYLDHNKMNRKELNPFYFLVRPEQMIYRHLPEDSQWQLLSSPISMTEFLSLPFVYPTFFELGIRLIDPEYSNTVSFDEKRGLASVLFTALPRAEFSAKIEANGNDQSQATSLVHYRADKQLWECLFAPQHGGLHELTIFGRMNDITNNDGEHKRMQSAMCEFNLDVPEHFLGTVKLPITYSGFCENQCQIFEPITTSLKPGSITTIHCRIPGACCGRLALDGEWISENPVKNDIYKRQITVPKSTITMYVRYSSTATNDRSYEGLFQYSIA